MEDQKFKIQKMYCPNCSHLLSGCENKDGIVKYTCPTCGCFIVSKKISRRKRQVEIIDKN